MKSNKNSRKFTSRALSFAICLALIVCAVFSFGFIGLPNRALADGEGGAVPAAKSENGIRFVQVAAGENFAIGLTYDGKLYGWSLNANQAGHIGDNDISIDTYNLGTYYPSVPTQIKVTFKRGPGAVGTNDWEDIDTYHSVKEQDGTDVKDRIVSIAATRTTAAFITEKNYIYTWGKDCGEDNKNLEGIYMQESASGQEHYLLLRPLDNKGGSNWYEPYIIDYNYYTISSTDDFAMTFITPSTGNPVSGLTIAAGEYNYIIGFQKDSAYYTYVWGSLLYSVPNIVAEPPYEYRLSTNNEETPLKGGVNVRKIFKTQYASSAAASVVAGGYTVGINGNTSPSGATSLQLRGRNFLSSQYDATSGYIYTVEAIDSSDTTTDDGKATATITYTQDSSSYDADNGVIGANGRSTTLPGDYATGVDIEQFYGRQAAGMLTTYNNPTSVSINAHGAALAATDVAKAIRYGVSLGNDVGYGISGGDVYAWGDNKYGQLNVASTVDKAHYSKPTKILSKSNDGLTTYVSVVAGKQLSADDKPLYSGGKASLTITAGAVSGFADDVKNDFKYISGALNSDGELFVWSYYDKDSKGTTQIKYGNVASPTDDNKFAAIYAGYGNHLFAITKLGKLVHIEYKDGEYAQDTYDVFKDTTGKTIENWEVEKVNSVTFTIPTSPEDAKNPDLGNVTFYVWSAATSSDTVELNGTSKKYNPLVKTNAVGDAYRILGLAADPTSSWDADDSKLTPTAPAIGFLKTSKKTATTFAPTFEYNSAEMSPKQQENMFKVEFVNDANGVGIKITPSQSSNGKAVKMTFWIARYNSEADFDNTKDDAVYYDYQECSIEFTIADTPSVVTYTTYQGENGDGNSYIPLLDPNNKYNSVYSVALMNVSTGVDELVKYLTGKETVDTGFVGKVMEQMKAQDAGFPAKSKITDGNLSYYLDEDEANPIYYTDKYQYLFYDRDANRVDLSGGSISKSPANSLGSKYENIDIVVAPVTVTVELNSAWNVVQANIDAIATDFNNKYGLYAFTFADGSMTFKYDVVRITAKDSTGVKYTDDDVSKPVTDINSQHVNMAINNVRTITTGWNETATSGNSTTITRIQDNMPAVLSQVSLRLKDESVIGIGDGKNVHTVNVTGLYVGTSHEINLSSYVNKVDGNNIYFTYDDGTDTEKFDDFNGQFTDETGSGVRVVNLTNNKLTITPTTQADFNFTVTVQRFANSTWDTFKDDNEKIYITFICKNITTFAFTANEGIIDKDTGFSAEITIKKTEQIDLLSGGNISGKDYPIFATLTGMPNANINAVKSKISIKSIETTENDVFTAAPSSGTAITITPKKAGTGVVMFIATVYGQSVKVSLKINVSFVTLLNDNSISLSGDEHVYVNTLMSQLKTVNSFNTNIDSYKILYDDKSKDSAGNDIYNAIYFTKDPYGTIEDSTGYPPFIKNVVFEGLSTSQPYINIVPSTSAADSSETYYMHVRYANTDKNNYAEALATDSGSVLEAVFAIKSGKVVVLLNAEQEVNINCKSSRKEGTGVWYTRGEGVNTVAYISAKELLDCLNEEDSAGYKIFHVSADGAAAQYFNYSFNGDNNVVITPQYNTDQPYVINVSVYNAARGISLVIAFDITVDGIVTVLPVTTDDDGLIGYGNIWLYSFIIVFGVLLIIFVIRMIVYWRKRAKQRALIKRNQELIRMRDRMHSKANIASKDQVVRTKMKMEDPKYAKMFNDMRKAKEEESGISLDNSDLAATAKTKSKKKKKGGKKSVAELKAELEAKKAAFAAAQAQSAQPVNPFGEVPLTDSGFGAPTDAFTTPVDDFGNPAGFDEPVMNEKEIVFDASDFGDGM